MVNSDFEILKKFSISINYLKPQVCIKVIWCPPSRGWTKVNVAGASGGVPIKAACGGIFKSHLGNHDGSFASNLDNENALFAELMRVILAIKHAHAHGWSNLWLKSDSKLVVLAFSKPFVVPWKIRNR